MTMIRVRLLVPHTHSGVLLPAGSVHAFDAPRARWLVSLAVAEPLPEPAPVAPPAPLPTRSTRTSRKD